MSTQPTDVLDAETTESRVNGFWHASVKPLLCDTGFQTDLGFLTAWLLLSSVPLLFLRGVTWLADPRFLIGFFATWLGLLAIWLFQRRTADATFPLLASAHHENPSAGWRQQVVLAVLLLTLCLLSYFFPMQKHFWRGFEEHWYFIEGYHTAWNRHVDYVLGRPMWGLTTWIVSILAPERVEGYLGATLALCFGNAWVLYLLLRKLVPGAREFAITAAILFIVNTSEPMRYFVLFATFLYWSALFWFLLALYLLVNSFQAQRRSVLAAACVLLGVALLSNEGLFPLALLGPVLLRLLPVDRKQWLVWSYAWMGTIALLALRFLVYLIQKGGASYQAKQSASAFRQPSFLLNNLLVQLKSIRTYFQLPQDLTGYYGLCWVAVFLVVALILTWSLRGATPRETAQFPSPRCFRFGTFLVLLALVLSIAPFLHMGNAGRTQYFAGPVQATLMAWILGYTCSRRWSPMLRHGLLFTTVGILAGNATVKSLNTQDHAKSLVRFEKTVHIFEQIQAVAPRIPADCLLLFVLENEATTPLGTNINLRKWTKQTWDVIAIQTTSQDPGREGVEFTPQHVIPLHFTPVRAPLMAGQYSYDRVVAFQLSEDGTARLLLEWPQRLLPKGSSAVPYDPRALLRPAPVEPLRILQHLVWSSPVTDIVDASDGIGIGSDWGPLETDGRDCYRWAGSQAEILVNSQGQASREVVMEIEPRFMRNSHRQEFIVLDEQQQIVATMYVTGRQRVRLRVPTSQDRLSLFRVCLRDSSAAVPDRGDAGFRAFVSSSPVDTRRVALTARDFR